MSKPYYAEYVNHMLRFYVAYKETNDRHFKSDVDQRNYSCVDKVLNSIPKYEQLMLIEIYRRRGPLLDNVHVISEQSRVVPKKIWSFINDITIKIAKERHLI